MSQRSRSLPGGPPPSRAAWLALLVVVAVAAAIRLRGLEIPLDRDEGAHALGARLLVEGWLPYRDFYDMRLPGIFLWYAGIHALFGIGPAAAHLALAIVNAATIALVFRIAARWLEAGAAITAAASFALLSLGAPVHGLSANTEHFVLLPALAGLALALRAGDGPRPLRLWGAGLLLGAAFLTKQHGAAFAGAAALALGWEMGTRDRRERVRAQLHLLAGFASPYLLCVVVFLALGAFDAFWTWTVRVPREYVAQVGWVEGWQNFTSHALPVLRASAPVWGIAALGLGASLGGTLPPARRFLWPLAAFSFLALCPGLLFRHHYFLLVLPAAALFAGVGAQWLLDRPALRRLAAPRLALGGALATLVCGISLAIQEAYLLRATPFVASRVTAGRNPFPESLAIGRYLRENSAPDARIAVLGSEPQIPLYARRLPASGFSYVYPLMEEHPEALAMQQRMIDEIERADPEYLVVLDPAVIPWSWLARPGSPRRIFDWLARYRRGYERVGLIEIEWLESRIHWGDDARRDPAAERYLEVLRRRR